MSAPSTSSGPAPVVAEHVTKVFGSADATTVALREVSAAFEPGTMTALMGPSGSGKSTLLYCLAGLETPTQGRALLLGQDLATLGRTRLAELRRAAVGFVFQSYNLVPSLSVLENVALPHRLAGARVDEAAILATLEAVGLGAKAHAMPAQLSGGQQQRVAVARVLHARPRVVFADEPTGALDVASGAVVLDLLRTLPSTGDQCVVMATHDPAAAARCDRVLLLRDGAITRELRRPTVDEVAQALAHLREDAA